MKNGIGLTVGFAFLLAMLITPAAMAVENAKLSPATTGELIEIVPAAASGGRDLYQGTLRIYMSEPVSRYRDYNNARYEFGFLDFAAVQGLAIADGEVYTHEVTWDASVSGFTGVDPDNIIAQVAVFNPTPYTAYSNPPSGAPFFAYWTDAAAEATPGVPGQNVENQDFTHTVFVEEATRPG